LSKNFGALRAVDNLSFSIEPHSIVGLIGPNGAGKTTLFNVISGFLPASQGSVKFKGKDITNLPPDKISKKGLVRTFQLTRVFDNFTVEENLLLPDLSFKMKKEKINWILERLNLWDKRKLLARELSGGEKKKLNLGMALNTKCEMLLLDEPFSGLSDEESKEMATLLKSLAEDENITMLIVEHKIGRLFEIVERVMVMNDGKLICEGKPREIAKNQAVIEAYLGGEYRVAEN
jgi:branched-chain amino acid transport system ATP-binding protein